MRIFIWLLRVAIFCILFAFALNNRHEASVNWFFASEARAPMIFILLAAFALGGLIGGLAMLPSWWRYRTSAQSEAPQPAPTASESVAPSHVVSPPRQPVADDGL